MYHISHTYSHFSNVFTRLHYNPSNPNNREEANNSTHSFIYIDAYILRYRFSVLLCNRAIIRSQAAKHRFFCGKKIQWFEERVQGNVKRCGENVCVCVCVNLFPLFPIQSIVSSSVGVSALIWTTNKNSYTLHIDFPNIKTKWYLCRALQSNVYSMASILTLFVCLCVQHIAQCNEMQRIMKSNKCEMANKQTN